MSADGLPLIGRPRKYSNVVAGGHGMYGYTLAPVTGPDVVNTCALWQGWLDEPDEKLISIHNDDDVEVASCARLTVRRAGQQTQRSCTRCRPASAHRS